MMTMIAAAAKALTSFPRWDHRKTSGLLPLSEKTHPLLQPTETKDLPKVIIVITDYRFAIVMIKEYTLYVCVYIVKFEEGQF